LILIACVDIYCNNNRQDTERDHIAAFGLVDWPIVIMGIEPNLTGLNFITYWTSE